MALTITVYPALLGVRDEMGDEQRGTGDPVPLPVTSIYPRTSAESEGPNRNGVTTGMTVLAPEGTRLSPHDEVELPGYPGRWQVSGEIAIWDARSNPVRRRGFTNGMRAPGLNVGCVQIDLERVDG